MALNVNKKEPGISLVMPKEYDEGGQLALAYRNIGFDLLEENIDPEGNYAILSFIKDFSTRELRSQLSEILSFNTAIESGFKYLYDSDDAERIMRAVKSGFFWRYLARFRKNPVLDASDDLNEIFEQNPYGPHIRLETRGDLHVIRIKERSFVKLSTRIRERIGGLKNSIN